MPRQQEPVIAEARATSTGMPERPEKRLQVVIACAIIGALIGVATITFCTLFLTFGAGVVAVGHHGWKVLLLGIGWGILIGTITGAVSAPRDTLTGKMFVFVVVSLIVTVVSFPVLIIVGASLGL